MTPIRVLIADSVPLVRSLLQASLAADGFDTELETGGGRSLLEHWRRRRPDVVLTNSDLTYGPVDDVLEAMCDDGARVLVLTRDASPERVTALLELGIRGYLVRDVTPEDVRAAVRSVACGHAVLHPVAASTVLDQWRCMRGSARWTSLANERLTLTRREAEVLTAMADGLGTKAIAHQLGVAVKTIENHKTRVFDKLGVRTQAHAVAVAINQGFAHSPGSGGGRARPLRRRLIRVGGTSHRRCALASGDRAAPLGPLGPGSAERCHTRPAPALP